MKQLHTPTEVKNAMQQNKPAVLVWSAAWCPDCVYLKTFIDKIVADNPEFDFYMLDRDELLDLAIEQEILGIPSFTVFKDSREIGRFVSKDRKNPEQIQAFLNTCKEA